MRLPTPPLLLITDRHQARDDLESIVAATLAGGCRWISLREKDLDRAERVDLLKRLLAFAQPYCGTVVVHEDVAAAIEAHVHGVHLPADGEIAAARARLGATALIGASCHDAKGVAAAARLGADYVTLSPVFLSTSKPGYGPPLGFEIFAAIARGAALPVIALGGVEMEQVPRLLRAGAAGVAVMGSVMRATDPRAETAALVAALTNFG